MDRIAPSLVVWSLALAAACGPVVVLEEGSDGESEASGDSEASSATVATTASSTTTTATSTSTTTSATTTPATTAVDPSDGDSGYCGLACDVAADCVPPNSKPIDFACVEGFCEYGGPTFECDETSCPSMAGLACASVEGVEVCVFPCTEDGGECLMLQLECTGTSDEGIAYCEPPPCLGAGEGEACIIEGVGQFGICVQGECVCTDDGQCTADGFACDV
jgi:hypothetical protein